MLLQSLMAYNTTASLEKLFRTNYVDFGKSQERFGGLSWSKSDSIYLDVKLDVFKRDNGRDFRISQNLTVGETDSKQFMGRKNQLINAAKIVR